MLELKIESATYSSKGEPILENINLFIKEPGIYGVVGKNGAGKTTLFKCILNEIKFKGSVLLYNEKISSENVFWLPTEPFLYNELTGKEFIDFYNLITCNKKVSPNEYVLDIPYNDFIGSYSTGMRKKVYLNALFTRKYDLYILDEPFNGLDVEANLLLLKLIIEISKTKIVIISSHILDSLYLNSSEIILLKERNIFIFQKEEYSKIKDYFM